MTRERETTRKGEGGRGEGEKGKEGNIGLADLGESVLLEMLSHFLVAHLIGRRCRRRSSFGSFGECFGRRSLFSLTEPLLSIVHRAPLRKHRWKRFDS